MTAWKRPVCQGLASTIQDGAGVVTESNFSRPALDAVTYDGNLIGYPFYFETSALVYNKTYMEALALRSLEAEADALAGEEAMQALDENGEPLEEEAEGENPEQESFTADVKPAFGADRFRESLPPLIISSPLRTAMTPRNRWKRYLNGMLRISSIIIFLSGIILM